MVDSVVLDDGDGVQSTGPTGPNGLPLTPDFDTLGSEWAALNKNPPLFTFDQNSTGQQCIKVTAAALDAVTGVQNAMKNSAFALSASDIPSSSGADLINNQFNKAEENLGTVLGKLSSMLSDMIETFGAAIGLFGMTETDNAIQFSQGDLNGIYGTTLTPATISTSTSSLQYGGTPQDQSSAGNWNSASSNYTPGDLYLYNTTPSQSVEDPSTMDWQQLQALSQMSPGAVQKVTNVAALWKNSATTLNSAFTTLNQQIANITTDGSWTGTSSKAAKTAVTDLANAVSYLNQSMTTTSDLLDYTAGWMDATAQAMPSVGPPIAGTTLTAGDLMNGEKGTTVSTTNTVFADPQWAGSGGASSKNAAGQAVVPSESATNVVAATGNTVVANPESNTYGTTDLSQPIMIQPFSNVTAPRNYVGPTAVWKLSSGVAMFAQTVDTLTAELLAHYQDAFAVYYASGFNETTPYIPAFTPAASSGSSGSKGSSGSSGSSGSKGKVGPSGSDGTTQYTGDGDTSTGDGDSSTATGDTAASTVKADEGSGSTSGDSSSSSDSSGTSSGDSSDSSDSSGSTDSSSDDDSTSSDSSGSDSSSSSDALTSAEEALSAAGQVAQAGTSLGQLAQSANAQQQAAQLQDQAKAAMGKLGLGKMPAMAGAAGGGGGIGAGPATEGFKELAESESKLFPRASLAGQLEGVAVGRASMAPQAGYPGYGPPGGMGGAAAGKGDQKDRETPEYLKDKKHLEDALGKAPGTVRPVLDQ